MKYLYILRHGTAGLPAESGDDFDRVLTPRGLLDISTLGTTLAEQKTRIDLIISSSAPRALQTARNMAELLNYPQSDIIERKSLYLAAAEKMLRTISKTDNAHTNVMIVGHNPGISDLASLLAPEAPYFPPGGMLCVKLFIDSWNEITSHCGTIEFQDFPVSLRNI